MRSGLDWERSFSSFARVPVNTISRIALSIALPMLGSLLIECANHILRLQAKAPRFVDGDFIWLNEEASRPRIRLWWQSLASSPSCSITSGSRKKPHVLFYAEGA
jgi:hypothetical protein